MYIWIDEQGRGRNRYVLFRRTFRLDRLPKQAHVTIFADTRYRLLVNGHTIAHGPARFFPSFPVSDCHNVGGHLVTGENVLAVIVNSYGQDTIHSAASRGGLIAVCRLMFSDASTMEIGTDGSWRCIESPGHRPNTPPMSFALNAAECVDLQRMPVAWDRPGFDDGHWQAAVELDGGAHWGELRDRPIPLLDESPLRPAAQVGEWTAMSPPEDVYSVVRSPANGWRHGMRWSASVTFELHSPMAQTVVLGGWWGRHVLNGRELVPRMRQDMSLRQDFVLELTEGGNTLTVSESLRHASWECVLGLPRNVGVTVAAEGLLSGASPVREHAWRRPVTAPPDSAVTGATRILLFDFDREVLGRVRLDVTAAAGTVIDVAYTERRHPDGTADIHGRHFVDMVERCITREGRQTWHGFHPRGFRYLELSVTGDWSAFELHDVDVTGAYYPLGPCRPYDGDDDTLMRVWTLGREALRNCMEDAYLDCPWRERGAYVGDVLVEYMVNLATFRDQALMRRTIELFLQGQGENGLIRPGAHGLRPGALPDYSAILLQCGRQYVTHAGDTTIISDYQERWTRLLSGLEALRKSGGDLFASEEDAYVDIAQHDARTSVSGVLNCFIAKAFTDGAWLLRKVGMEVEAARWDALAARTAAAIRDAFWDDARGLFVDRIEVCGSRAASVSVHGNTLPLLYEIASPAQTARVVPWLLEQVADNFLAHEGPTDRRAVRVNAYFSHYVLCLLRKLGRKREALDFIRVCWGYMLREGAWTTWESFGGDPGGSLCHAWSASPTWFLGTVPDADSSHG